MIKPILAALLTISSLYLIKVNYDALRQPEPELSSKEKVQAAGALKRLEEKSSFNPAVPRTLPNLYSGYLFNADRHLEGAGAGAEETEDGRDEAPQVNVYEVSYNGSLIFGETRKALISYPLQKGSRRGKAVRGPSHATLSLGVGDKVGGFTVSAIEEGEIVFNRSGETVKKLLYDKEKERSASPQPQARTAPTPTRRSTAAPTRTSQSKPTPARRTVPPPLPDAPDAPEAPEEPDER